MAFITIYFPTACHGAHQRELAVAGEGAHDADRRREEDAGVERPGSRREDQGLRQGRTRSSNRQGVYELLVSYRSGDMWAPQVEQTEALRAEDGIFRRNASQDNRPRSMTVWPACGWCECWRRLTRSVRNRGEAVRYERVMLCIAPDVKLGKNVKLSKFINLYGCEIGDEHQDRRFCGDSKKRHGWGGNCKISSHTFICEGVTIEDKVFIGHSVTFINDTYPRATTAQGELQTEADWKVENTVVRKGASIGSGATILSNRHGRSERHRGRRKRGDEETCPTTRS